MRKTIAAAVAASLIGLAAIPAAANAATTVNWRQQTCNAAAAYQRHPSRARLETLVVDSFRVAPKYLGADVGQLYADVEGGAKAKYVARDEKWIRSDCEQF